MERGLIAFDPGKGGGFARMDAKGDIDLRPWTAEYELTDQLRSLDPKAYEAVVEDVPVFVSNA